MAEAWINEDNALERTAFNELPVALQRRVIRKAYTLIMGESRELNFDQVEAILRLKEEQCTVLPGGLKAYRRGNIYFAADKPPLPQYLESYPLQIDGQWHAIDNWGWEYQAQVIGDTLPVIGMFSFILPLEIANTVSYTHLLSNKQIKKISFAIQSFYKYHYCHLYDAVYS